MDVALLQSAAKKIETDGDEGLYAAAQLVGMPTALALLITHLRRAYGSMQGWPADPAIDGRVMEFLRREVPAVQNFLGQDGAYFYTGEWYCFDNFSAFTVYWRDQLWPTAEHAYQAAKYTDPAVISLIRLASSAHEAKKIGNDPQYSALIRPDWGKEVKRSIMEEILRAKFSQHEYVQKKLRESRGKILVEDSNRDHLWGRGQDWNGENWLGELWMKLQDEFFPV